MQPKRKFLNVDPLIDFTRAVQPEPQVSRLDVFSTIQTKRQGFTLTELSQKFNTNSVIIKDLMTPLVDSGLIKQERDDHAGDTRLVYK